MNWNWKLKPGPINVSETTIVRSVGLWTDLRSDKIFIGLAIYLGPGKWPSMVGTTKWQISIPLLFSHFSKLQMTQKS